MAKTWKCSPTLADLYTRFCCSSVGCWGTQCEQTLSISSCYNAQTIVASLALCENHAAISGRMSVIVRHGHLQKECVRICISLSNVLFGRTLHLSLCMFVFPSQNINRHWSFLHRQHVKVEFRLRNYSLLLENKQQFTSHNWREEFRSNSSLCKLNTYKTCWIHSKLFVWTGVTILSTCAKFCHISVTRMRKKNRRCYFLSVFRSILNIKFLYFNIFPKFSLKILNQSRLTFTQKSGVCTILHLQKTCWRLPSWDIVNTRCLVVKHVGQVATRC